MTNFPLIFIVQAYQILSVGGLVRGGGVPAAAHLRVALVVRGAGVVARCIRVRPARNMITLLVIELTSYYHIGMSFAESLEKFSCYEDRFGILYHYQTDPNHKQQSSKMDSHCAKSTGSACAIRGSYKSFSNIRIARGAS